MLDSSNAALLAKDDTEVAFLKVDAPLDTSQYESN